MLLAYHESHRASIQAEEDAEQGDLKPRSPHTTACFYFIFILFYFFQSSFHFNFLPSRCYLFFPPPVLNLGILRANACRVHSCCWLGLWFITARSFVLMTDSHSSSLIRPGESGESSLTFLHLRRFQLQQLGYFLHLRWVCFFSPLRHKGIAHFIISLLLIWENAGKRGKGSSSYLHILKKYIIGLFFANCNFIA